MSMEQHYGVCFCTICAHDLLRAALAFYCIGTLDVLGTLETQVNESERENWREWYWELQTSACRLSYVQIIIIGKFLISSDRRKVWKWVSAKPIHDFTRQLSASLFPFALPSYSWKKVLIKLWSSKIFSSKWTSIIS